jgi:hypothetical protein
MFRTDGEQIPEKQGRRRQPHVRLQKRFAGSERCENGLSPISIFYNMKSGNKVARERLRISWFLSLLCKEL